MQARNVVFHHARAMQDSVCHHARATSNFIFPHETIPKQCPFLTGPKFEYQILAIILNFYQNLEFLPKSQILQNLNFLPNTQSVITIWTKISNFDQMQYFHQNLQFGPKSQILIDQYLKNWANIKFSLKSNILPKPQ